MIKENIKIFQSGNRRSASHSGTGVPKSERSSWYVEDKERLQCTIRKKWFHKAFFNE